MASQQHCTVEQLAEVFEKHQEEIIAEWRVQSSQLLKKLNLDKLTLTDHLPDLIADITSNLAHPKEGISPAEASMDSPPAHGVQRFYDGLDVGEVVTEYNLLRIAFTTIAERYDLYIVGEATRIINHHIDEGVRLAVMAFAEQQALMRKKQEDEHLAFIAHDLRTPLYAASLLVDELREGLDPKSLADTGDLFEILQRNLQKVENLIKRVLNTKVRPSGISKALEPVQRTFELRPLVQRLILDTKPVFSKDGIQVINQIPSSLTVYADAELISQVFQNLLSNAFKYSKHGKVTLNAREEGSMVTCSVSDNGTGIPEEMLGKVFEKHATDPAKSGTGFGLTIVKQIVEAHGGTVRVESIHGAGATFVFTLPMESLPPSA